MEERRLLLAVALSLVVVTAYQLLFPAARPRPAAPRAAASVAPVPAASAPAPAAPPPSTAGRPSPSPTEPVIADDQERRVEVEGPDLSLALTNRGARLVSWRLVHYSDARGRPEDMVQTVPGGPRPLDLETGDAGLDGRLREALFRPSTPHLDLRNSAERRLVLQFSDGELSAEKGLSFEERGYLVGVDARVRRGGRDLPVRIVWGPGIGTPTAAEREISGYQGPQAVAFVGGEVVRTPGEKLVTPQNVTGASFLGVESRYFAALWLTPQGTAGGELRSRPLPAFEDGSPRVAPEALVSLAESGGRALLYVGPKDYHILAATGHGLGRVVPVGDWIGPLVVPLLGLLRFVHRYIGNYGWSIVALTVLINLVMGPLRHYSIKNGFKMAKLAPEMRVIQDRYRKVPALDPRRQQMQEEIQALYARHGMSMGTQMAVGCVPILLTMPFLFAFYRVLDVSIDLRGADFLWIRDLSQKDPLFLTPLLMGVSMFVMQRMTPSTMDPAQQRIMTLMPLVLVGMFFWAPAGLNLYWLVSNLCSIVQQGITLQLLKREQRAPAKERRQR
jgi:YidC/Oxa1 family membrane protein insertase